tara:strand:+ start:8542 stop:9273 length:732 start_codon:yes stop_codon:yes gene_type:complete
MKKQYKPMGLSHTINSSQVAKIWGINMIHWARSRRFDAHLAPLEYYEYCCHQASVDGLWLEFGVCTGATIGHLSRNMVSLKKSKTMYGFDSFQGLPEDWHADRARSFKKGETFGTTPGVVPSVENCEMVVGLFEDTLPRFVKKNKKPISLIHIDCDLYSSTKTIFTHLEEFFVPGTIIMFDELINFKTFAEHEYRALKEFIRKTGFSFEFIAHTTGEQAALRLLPPGFELYNKFTPDNTTNTK